MENKTNYDEDFEKALLLREKNNIICHEERKQNFSPQLQTYITYQDQGTSVDIRPECNSISFEQLGSMLASGYSNGRINVYDSNNGELKHSLKSSDDCVTSLKWKPHCQETPKNILQSVNINGDISCWHVSSRKILYQFSVEDSPFLSFDYSPCGNFFVVGNNQSELTIYDDNLKTRVYQYTEGTSYKMGHQGKVYSIAFNKDQSSFDNMFASGGSDRRIILYDIRTHKHIGEIKGPVIYGNSVDLKGNFIVTGSYNFDSFVQVWDIRTFNNIMAIRDDKIKDQSVYACKISPGVNNLLGIGSYKENSFALYNTETNSLLLQTKFLSKPCCTLDFSNKGDCVAFGTTNGGIRIINL